MKRYARILLAASITAAIACAATNPAHAADAPELKWPTPTFQNRLWTRWWWMGNAVDPVNITKQLEMFHTAGLGGVEICPIYGVIGAEDRYVDFLSPKWMNLLAHTYRETKRLDMAVDMTTGTGWPFGGKNVDDATASSSLILKSFDHNPTPAELPKGKLISVVASWKDGTKIIAPAAEGPPPPPGALYTAAVQSLAVQKVKRSAPGGEGNVVDPYSVPALNKYLSDFDKAFEAFPDVKPRSQFHDSFEYYQATYTPEIFAEFQKRRGYDLKPHLAELAGDAGAGLPDTVARVRHDYRETLSDLHLAYMARWAEWSHSHGSISRNQAHGGPGNLIDVYANADIPECEMFHLYDESQFPFLKLASSAAHVTGKKLASSESFTWLGEHFSVPLSDVKPAADFLFLAGVNHEFLHGIPYSPEDAAWPGWNFYASVNFGPYGGLWHDFPAFTAYIARCQSILQDNKPANDVLLYVPFHEFWTVADPKNLMTQFTTPGTWMAPFEYYKLASALSQNGYAYDEVSDALLKTAKVNPDGTINMAGNSYKSIIIPKTPMLPVDTLKQLIDLANQGAAIAFEGNIPTDVPGLTDLANRQKQIKDLAKIDFEIKHLGSGLATVGKGKILAIDDIPELLSAAAGPGEPMYKNGLRCIRRLRPDGYDYFVVNRSDKVVDKVPLATIADSAIILDPRFDNRSGTTSVLRGKDEESINLHINPGESYFIRTFTDKIAQGPAWRDLSPIGAPTPINGTWNVAFIEGGPALPKPFTIDKPDANGKLPDWTAASPDPEAKRFAGTAKYTITFNTPVGGDARSGDDMLDLGEVADSARVTLDGKSLGTLFSRPFQIILPAALPPGPHKLEIEVTNVAANRIRDMDQRSVQWKIFRDINIVDTSYTPMDASKWPLRPAGLIGPIQIVPMSSMPK